ncbi:MAG: hypothetical protein ACLFQI_02525 [Halochromatium sp.]|uniref:hypothetical protein n=1 Tax=Halochromatium sp. TaxID=2049430 RepID=UPI0039789207
MSDSLQSVLTAIPEAFFHRLEERLTQCTAVAYRQAQRTPPDAPAYRMRLGNARYFERAEAFRRSAEDIGLHYRYEHVNTHAFALATSGPFRITHAKVEHWGDPIEQKEYKQALARHNPSSGEPGARRPETDPDSPLFAVVLVLYARPGTGQDETIPMRLGFGIPTCDLRGWHLLKTLDALYLAYAERAPKTLDQARPVLRADPARTHQRSS